MPPVLPDSAFNDWRLVALTPLPTWVLGAVCVALGLAIWSAWRGHSVEPSPRRRRLLTGLRVLAAAAVLALVLEPGMELLATSRIRGRVALLFDVSRSMSLPAAPGSPTRAAAATKLLEDTSGRAALEERFQLETSAFAGRSAISDPAAITQMLASDADPAVLGRDRSAILPALEEAARSGGSRPLAGIVLVTDGADTGALGAFDADGDNGDLKDRLEKLGAPVVALDVTRGGLRDIAIGTVKADDFAFVRNTVDIDVELLASGLGKITVPVVLEREGQVVTTQQVSVDDGKPGHVKMSFMPDTTGEFAYTVRVPLQPGELVASNNARSFVQKVIRDRVRVLHVAGKPSWDERFMRSFLKRDPNVDLISFFILRTPTDLQVGSTDELSLIPFPTQEIFHTQLSTFDLVIFHNFVSRPYNMSGYLPGIAEYVKNGGSLLMLGGDNSFSEGLYAGTAIEEILPVELEQTPQPASTDSFQARLTAAGRRHPLTELEPGEGPNDAAWRRLPQLNGLNRVSAKPGAQVLVEHPTLNDAGGRPAPVVAVWEVGRGRTAAFMTDSTWMWSFVGAREGRTQRAYDDLFHAAIRWLVRDPDFTQVRVEADKDRYSPADPVAFVVKARSRDYGPAAGARVEVEVRQIGSLAPGRVLQGVVGTEGTVRVEAGSLAAGAWRATAVARREGEELGTAEDAFVVEEAGPELARPAPRPDILKFIADATDGVVLDASKTGLADLPLKDPQRVEIGQRRSNPIWDRAWVLAFLALVLGVEWFLRRRWGFY